MRQPPWNCYDRESYFLTRPQRERRDIKVFPNIMMLNERRRYGLLVICHNRDENNDVCMNDTTRAFIERNLDLLWYVASARGVNQMDVHQEAFEKHMAHQPQSWTYFEDLEFCEGNHFPPVQRWGAYHRWDADTFEPVWANNRAGRLRRDRQQRVLTLFSRERMQRAINDNQSKPWALRLSG